MSESRSNFYLVVCLISAWYVVITTGWSITSLGLTGADNPNCYVVPNKICPNENITFHLYTSNNPTTPILLDLSNKESIANAPFIPNVPVKILFHGYTGYLDYSPNMELRPAYFQGGRQINIICIDYGKLAKDGCYPHAVDNIDLVGKCTAEFFEGLEEIRPELSICQFHLIGFSLGAQVTGQVVNHYKKCKFDRITALDAAAPLFHWGLVNSDRVINEGDAHFVDTLHTSRDKGKYLPFGDFDSYANEGKNQPGCKTNSSCSHVRAVEYYAESINAKVGFWAYECDFSSIFWGTCSNEGRTAVVGEYASPQSRGTFNFKTNDKPPFAIPAEPAEE